MQYCDPDTRFCSDGGAQASRDVCELDTHRCGNTNRQGLFQGTGKQYCYPATQFCSDGGAQASRLSCEPDTHRCGKTNSQGLFQGDGVQYCYPTSHFCFTSGIEIATCDTNNAIITNNIYDCKTGVKTCDNSDKFCHTSQAFREDCNKNIYDCDGIGWYNPGTEDTVTGYLPPETEPPPSGGWDAALIRARTREYRETRKGTSDESVSAADQIGAAYAHARGHTGRGVTISNVGLGRIASDHKDLSGQLVRGYVAHSNNSGSGASICERGDKFNINLGGSCSNNDLHVAGIIVGKSGNGDGTIQGIAYNARIKPISIYGSHDRNLTTSAKRANGIRQASGSNIAVMNNSWNQNEDIFNRDRAYKHKWPVRFSFGDNAFAVGQSEKDAWKEAAKHTVMVFPQGDHGFNSVNGMIKRFDGKRTARFSSRVFYDVNPLGDVRWTSAVNKNHGGKNVGGTFRDMLKVEPALQGATLFVIALDEGNDIHKYSNGCGDIKAWCLGAPGVDIKSANRGGGYEWSNGTPQAAAHVSGAVAILAEAFPDLGPAELVSLILDSADDLGAKGVDDVYGHGRLNLARASEPVGSKMTASASGASVGDGITIDNSGVTLPTSFGESLTDLTAGFTDDYDRAFIGFPTRIAQQNIAFTLDETMATWDSPELQSITLDSNSKMQFSNYDESEDAKDTLMFTHHLPNHTIGFSYNEESKTPDLMLAGAAKSGDEMHFQKILPIAKDLMQLNSTYKLSKSLTVKNSLTSGEFDTGNRFNEAMANLSYTGENSNLTIGAGTLKEYGQFLGASGTGAYQLSDATRSQVTHLAITQNLPLNSSVKVKYTGFKTEVDMRYSSFAKINDLTANEYQLSFGKRKVFGKSDSLNIDLIQPFAVTNGSLQQSTVLGYTADGDYNNVTQNYDLAPTNRRQQIRMTWQNQINHKTETKLFISMQYENHIDNLRDKEDSQILGGISTRF